MSGGDGMLPANYAFTIAYTAVSTTRGTNTVGSRNTTSWRQGFLGRVDAVTCYTFLYARLSCRCTTNSLSPRTPSTSRFTAIGCHGGKGKTCC